MSTEHDALRNLLNVLDEKIDDAPEHPWIPGVNFADGKIEVAIEDGRKALEAPSVLDDLEVPAHDPLRVLDAKPTHPMVVAYHVLYDYKDAQEPGSDTAWRAYEALKSLSGAMAMMGITTPDRRDAPRES